MQMMTCVVGENVTTAANMPLEEREAFVQQHRLKTKNKAKKRRNVG
jgi:hypothetical protein